MESYYDNESLSELQARHPTSPDGMIRLPESVINGVPYTVRNTNPGDIIYVNPNTVFRDAKTQIITIDTTDLRRPLPTTENELRYAPALMRLYEIIDKQLIDGYIIDLRRVAVYPQRDSGLKYGTDSERFIELHKQHGVTFPLGIVINVGGRAEYIGDNRFVETATDMIRRVDAYRANNVAPTVVRMVLSSDLVFNEQSTTTISPPSVLPNPASRPLFTDSQQGPIQ